MTDTSTTDLVLEHIGRYRISFPKVMERVFADRSDLDAAIRALKSEKLITSLGRTEGYGSLFGGYSAYQLTVQGTARTGVSPKRAKPLNENALERSFRILWACCMGKDRFSCLDKQHLVTLLGTPLGSKDVAYCMEMGGKRRIYRIRLIGVRSSDAYALRETREDLLKCADLPVVKDFVEHGRYGNLLVVSKPERRKRLEEQIQARSLKQLGHVRVTLAPDLVEIKEALRA